MSIKEGFRKKNLQTAPSQAIKDIAKTSSPIRLPNDDGWILINDDLVFIRKIDFDRPGFLPLNNLPIGNTNTVSTLRKGFSLNWSAKNNETQIDGLNLRTREGRPSKADPSHIFTTYDSFIFFNPKSLTVFGFKLLAEGEKEKGIWQFDLKRLKAIYKPKDNERRGNRNQLWIFE